MILVSLASLRDDKTALSPEFNLQYDFLLAAFVITSVDKRDDKTAILWDELYCKEKLSPRSETRAVNKDHFWVFIFRA